MMQIALEIPVFMIRNVPSEAVCEPRLRVRQVDPTTEPGWDSLVLSHPDHSFFHGAAWARVLKEAYGFTPQYFIFSNDGRATLLRSPDQPEQEQREASARQQPHPTSFPHPPSPISQGRATLPRSPIPQALDAAGIVGILPLMEAKSWIRGTRGVSLPFTDECAPLWSSSADANMLLETIFRHGKARGWKFLEIRGGRDLFGSVLNPPSPIPHGRATLLRSPDQPEQEQHKVSARQQPHPTSFPHRPSPIPHPPSPIPESGTHWGHVLDLAGGADDLFRRFKPSVRRAIRKSEKAGLHVEITRDPDAIRQFYRLHCLTRGRQGVPPQPFSFFEAIQKHIIDPGHGFITLATLGADSERRLPARPEHANPAERRLPARREHASCQPAEQNLAAPVQGQARPVNPNLNPNLNLSHPPVIAASVYFHLGRRAIYKFAASDFRWQHLRANNLVMWTAIQHLAREGFTTLDFGRTDPSNSGLRAFKLGWGTAEARLPYYRYDFRSKTFVEKADQSRWAGRLGWLPGPFARLVGALLYPHLE